MPARSDDLLAMKDQVVTAVAFLKSYLTTKEGHPCTIIIDANARSISIRVKILETED